ncbi:DUF1801 domain-containing protein [Dactylosporangium sp. NPDC048998]|uniref:DUF1801 domain-containing protein n=1 Tax=Dactylosporangium sp. NPDC048998 TaxID=3363976 RepID=UPI0037115A7E
MTDQSPAVDALLDSLDHPMKDSADRLRRAILASDEGITEHVKWNAPSFRFAGEDRVTFRFHPKGQLQLVFHRGAKVREDRDSFVFHDDTGLLQWPAADRGVVTLASAADADAAQDRIVQLVGRWIRT